MTDRNESSGKSPRLTMREIQFLLNETNASLSCGATDPLFQQCADKLRAMLVARSRVKR